MYQLYIVTFTTLLFLDLPACLPACLPAYLPNYCQPFCRQIRRFTTARLSPARRYTLRQGDCLPNLPTAIYPHNCLSTCPSICMPAVYSCLPNLPTTICRQTGSLAAVKLSTSWRIDTLEGGCLPKVANSTTDILSTCPLMPDNLLIQQPSGNKKID